MCQEIVVLPGRIGKTENLRQKFHNSLDQFWLWINSLHLIFQIMITLIGLNDPKYRIHCVNANGDGEDEKNKGWRYNS